MDYLSIPRNKWSLFFNQISRLARGRQMQLELIGEDFGDQIEKDWDFFEGLSYDRPKDILWVHAPGLEHSIEEPREVVIGGRGLLSLIGIQDSQGHIQIVRFRAPALLSGTID